MSFVGNVSMVSERLAMEDLPHVTLPKGGSGTKRITFLSEVRNRALRPLRNSSFTFDKLLFINDVIFNPIDAAQLLFSTNVDANGKSQYSAVCAMDFDNPFKFYDRFATRDLEGHETGVPFFPWFTNSGDAASRKDAVAQKDAVRVRSCWGGMTAFEAKWFQDQETGVDTKDDVVTEVADIQLSPLHFRYELDPFWDASECCLIHADLTYLRHGRNSAHDSGIYMNPYIRVAYDSKTLAWLPYTRRLERLYPFIHDMVNRIGGLPHSNTRRLEQPGDEVVEEVWKYYQNAGAMGSNWTNPVPNGSYHQTKRIVGPGRFCGRRALSILKDDVKDGEKSWMKLPLPPPPS